MSSQRRRRRLTDPYEASLVNILAWVYVALTACAFSVWASSSDHLRHLNTLDRPGSTVPSAQLDASSVAPLDTASASSGAAISLSKRGLHNAQRASGIDGLFRPSSVKQLDLLGVILASTIEGGLFGIDRASGDILWTLSQPHSSSNEPRSGNGAAFEPLVSAAYGEHGSSFASLAAEGLRGHGHSAEHFRELQETGIYIVEPSSAGDIYVLTAEQPSSRVEDSDASQARTHLSKLPLTLPQLVDLSPFSFPGDDSRVFVGKKRVRLVELDISSGRVGAIFGGEEGVWCGSNANDDLSGSKDACGEEDAEGGTTGNAQWVYIGRTDYSLTIHARSRPHLTQTLRFSTFSANAADRDITSLWVQAGAANRRDHRSFLSTPERGGLLCLNTTRQQSEGLGLEASALWNSRVEGTIAGIFDVVQPVAASRRFTPSGSIKPAAASARPIIVPHLPVEITALRGQAVMPPSTVPLEEHAVPKPSVSAHLQTYLGISEGSLYVMSSRHYPLSTFSAAAAAALPAGAHQRASPSPSHSSMQHIYEELQQLPANNQGTCASYKCWLGSYTVGIDTTAEGMLRASLQGQPHYMSIDDGRGSVLGIEDGSRASPLLPPPAGVNDSQPKIPVTSSPPLPVSADANSQYFIAGLQILGISFAALLGAIMYFGLQEQKRQAQITADYLAHELEWAPPGEAIASVSDSSDSADTQSSHLDYPSSTAPNTAPSKLMEAAEAIVLSNARNHRTVSNAKSNSEHPTHSSHESKTQTMTAPPPPPRTDEDANAVAEALLQEEMDGSKPHADGKRENTAAKKRRRRGKRGGAAVNAKLQDHQDQEGSTGGATDLHGHKRAESSSRDVAGALVTHNARSTSDVNDHLQTIVPPVVPPPEGLQNPSLEISDQILGYGSSGTVVFKGSFQGRAVAIKRLLRDFVNVASKEVSLLESADNHPNVIRYFYKELTGSFLFIALELCPASLADIVERTAEYRELSNLLDPKRALRQITAGLRHLHSLSIVHRDIKPQNILVSINTAGQLKMLLSDFGLSKRLDGLAQTSFSQTINNPGGTVGWRAPELLRGDVTLDTSDESSASSATVEGGSSGLEERKRLTRAVDIFSLGCVAYYVLSNGDHPFGGRFEREMNIMQRKVRLSRLDGLGEEGHEAQQLIMAMIESEPSKRPSPTDILIHPYFWNSARRLAFLQDASDRFEVMETNPPHPVLVALESDAVSVVDRSWQKKMDKMFIDDLGKFRTYGNGVQDLLRALRNKKHHFQDLPLALRRKMEPLPDGFLAYFTTKFPLLFLRVYMVVASDALLRSEFATYFSITSEE